eukprot:TRINITY_DN12077_c0_g1_i1.p1 TRINITY_DN12077_c0_g1~~TRINITY_DN12077_c0_g1_i1.p1  ORF type:complete len:1034 (-),score=219.95 TRINITY_DN12077_c0_g1_i1:49-3150(-)
MQGLRSRSLHKQAHRPFLRCGELLTKDRRCQPTEENFAAFAVADAVDDLREAAFDIALRNHKAALQFWADSGCEFPSLLALAQYAADVLASKPVMCPSNCVASLHTNVLSQLLELTPEVAIRAVIVARAMIWLACEPYEGSVAEDTLFLPSDSHSVIIYTEQLQKAISTGMLLERVARKYAQEFFLRFLSTDVDRPSCVAVAKCMQSGKLARTVARLAVDAMDAVRTSTSIASRLAESAMHTWPLNILAAVVRECTVDRSMLLDWVRSNVHTSIDIVSSDVVEWLQSANCWHSEVSNWFVKRTATASEDSDEHLQLMAMIQACVEVSQPEQLDEVLRRHASVWSNTLKRLHQITLQDSDRMNWLVLVNRVIAWQMSGWQELVTCLDETPIALLQYMLPFAEQHLETFAQVSGLSEQQLRHVLGDTETVGARDKSLLHIQWLVEQYVSTPWPNLMCLSRMLVAFCVCVAGGDGAYLLNIHHKWLIQTSIADALREALSLTVRESVMAAVRVALAVPREAVLWDVIFDAKLCAAVCPGLEHSWTTAAVKYLLQQNRSCLQDCALLRDRLLWLSQHPAVRLHPSWCALMQQLWPTDLIQPVNAYRLQLAVFLLWECTLPAAMCRLDSGAACVAYYEMCLGEYLHVDARVFDTISLELYQLATVQPEVMRTIPQSLVVALGNVSALAERMHLLQFGAEQLERKNVFVERLSWVFGLFPVSVIVPQAPVEPSSAILDECGKLLLAAGRHPNDTLSLIAQVLHCIVLLERRDSQSVSMWFSRFALESEVTLRRCREAWQRYRLAERLYCGLDVSVLACTLAHPTVILSPVLDPTAANDCELFDVVTAATIPLPRKLKLDDSGAWASSLTVVPKVSAQKVVFKVPAVPATRLRTRQANIPEPPRAYAKLVDQQQLQPSPVVDMQSATQSEAAPIIVQTVTTVDKDSPTQKKRLRPTSVNSAPPTGGHKRIALILDPPSPQRTATIPSEPMKPLSIQQAQVTTASPRARPLAIRSKTNTRTQPAAAVADGPFSFAQVDQIV